MTILAVFGFFSFASGGAGPDKKDIRDEKTLEISWFEGGYGRAYVEYAIDKFKEKYPDIEVIAEINPKNHDQLRPRFVAGNPPDIFLANESFFDYFALIAEDQLMPLNDLLDSPAPDGRGKFKDIFLSGILEGGKKDGNYYLAPAFNMFHGLWYSATLFKQNGWQPPLDYGSFVEVSKKIKQGGKMAPFTYQGIYPQYPLRVLFLPSIGVFGGEEALKRINNLEPGAWKQEAVLRAAQRFKEYVSAYLMEGSLALNHTQAQMEFINKKAAFIPCGTWLDSEMKGNWPDDFELTYLTPPMHNSKNDNKYVVMQVLYIAIPAQAKNPKGAEEFLKLIYSRDVRSFIAKQTSGIMPIVNSTEGLEHLLSPVIVKANEELNQENVKVYLSLWRVWYKPLFKKVLDSLTALAAGKITPEQFCSDVEKEAERIRNDSTIPKYRVD